MEKQKLAVLLIEDDIDYASLLHLRLTRVQSKNAQMPEVQITHVHSLADAKEALAVIPIELVLLDLSLPDSKGLSGLQQIKEKYPQLPVVVLTVTDDEEMAMTAIQMGAQDYLVKDEINVALLMRAMRHAVKRGNLITTLETNHIAALQASEENLRAVVTQLADGIAVLDKAGNVEFVNPSLLRLLDKTAEEGVGRHFGYHYVPDTSTEIELQTREGESRILEMRTSSILWQGKEAYLVLVRNISSQKRAARAMEQYARELEVRNEDLNAFAHTVAHNLKAPLTHVILAADLLDLNAYTMSDECVPYVKTIVSYGRKMTDIIDELLLLAEVRSREDLLLLPLDMARILKDVEARLKTIMVQHGARLSIAQDVTDWPRVIGYAPWVEEVWANYLANAIKYGGRPPILEIGSTLSNGGMVRFWVHDNGEGIPAEDQRNLFQPFARLKPYSTDGHGLGLSIVRRIVEKLGGEVGLESQVGEGSTFSFTLPLASV